MEKNKLSKKNFRSQETHNIPQKKINKTFFYIIIKNIYKEHHFDNDW